MPEFGVWTTLYSVMFAVFAIGWGFWLGIIAIVVNLTNLLIYFEPLMKALERRLLCLTKTTKPII
jgi:hypothetical protein